VSITFLSTTAFLQAPPATILPPQKGLVFYHNTFKNVKRNVKGRTTLAAITTSQLNYKGRIVLKNNGLIATNYSQKA
jgi:hypothetical protein